MAFISSGYNPANPMEGRNSDIGPRPYDNFFPPVIKNNFGKWLYHEILEPGVLMHVAESGDKVYTVRCGAARTVSPFTFVNAAKSQTDTVADTFVSPHVTTLNSWLLTKKP